MRNLGHHLSRRYVRVGANVRDRVERSERHQPAERPLRADEDVLHPRPPVTRNQRVDIVTADSPLHLGKTLCDLIRVAHRQGD